MNEPTPMKDNPYVIPLVVAVSGHRDIPPACAADVKEKLKDKFTELRTLYPSTPLCCLSGLAEGADMLCADVALECGIKVVPVLPAPPEAFKKDLQRPAHPERTAEELEKHFNSLLQRCEKPVVVAQELEQDDPTRYARVGSYLFQQSHTLFALWDGDATIKEGGTAHVVAMFRNNLPDPCGPEPSLLDAPEPRPVWHLCTPRNTAVRRPLDWTRLSETPEELQAAEAKFTALDRFNRRVRKLYENDPKQFQESLDALHLPKDGLLPQDQPLLRAYAAADAMANHYHARINRLIRLMFILTGLLVLSYSTYSGIWGSPVALSAYVLCFLFGFACYRWERSREIYTWFLDTRGLAEIVRVQLFFRFAGVQDKASDHYLRKHRSEVTWIRDVLRTVDPGIPRARKNPELAVHHWIEAQLRYFNNRRHANNTAAARYEHLAKWLVSAGMTVAAVMLAIHVVSETCLDNVTLKNTLLLLVGLPPAIGAIVAGYAFQLCLEQHCKQYGRMQSVYQRAFTRCMHENLACPEKEREFAAVVEELGCEALAENADWILLHRARPLTAPQ